MQDFVVLIILLWILFFQVDAALAPGYADEPLVEGFRVTLKRSDLATLSNLNWLNDEVRTFTRVQEIHLEQQHTLFFFSEFSSPPSWIGC